MLKLNKTFLACQACSSSVANKAALCILRTQLSIKFRHHNLPHRLLDQSKFSVEYFGSKGFSGLCNTPLIENNSNYSIWFLRIISQQEVQRRSTAQKSCFPFITNMKSEFLQHSVTSLPDSPEALIFQFRYNGKFRVIPDCTRKISSKAQNIP